MVQSYRGTFSGTYVRAPVVPRRARKKKTQLKAQGPSRTCNESKEEEDVHLIGQEFPEALLLLRVLRSLGIQRCQMLPHGGQVGHAVVTRWSRGVTGVLLLRVLRSLGIQRRQVLPHGGHAEVCYRGTSLIRNNPFIGPYSSPMLRALRWS